MRVLWFLITYAIGLSPFLISYPTFTLYVFLLSIVLIGTRNIGKGQQFTLVPTILSNVSILMYGLFGESLFSQDVWYTPLYHLLFIASLLFAASMKRMQENLTKRTNKVIVDSMMSLLPVVVYFVLLFLIGKKGEIDIVFFILYSACFSLLAVRGKYVVLQGLFLLIHVASLIYVMNYAKTLSWMEWAMMFAILIGNAYKDQKEKKNEQSNVSRLFKRRIAQ